MIIKFMLLRKQGHMIILVEVLMRRIGNMKSVAAININMTATIIVNMMTMLFY